MSHEIFFFVEVGLHQFQYKIFSQLSIISKLLQSVCIVGGWTTPWQDTELTEVFQCSSYENGWLQCLGPPVDVARACAAVCSTKRPQSNVVTGRHSSLNFCLLYTENIFVDNKKLINEFIHTWSHKVRRTFRFSDHDRILRSIEHSIRIIASARK